MIDMYRDEVFRFLVTKIRIVLETYRICTNTKTFQYFSICDITSDAQSLKVMFNASLIASVVLDRSTIIISFFGCVIQ